MLSIHYIQFHLKPTNQMKSKKNKKSNKDKEFNRKSFQKKGKKFRKGFGAKSHDDNWSFGSLNDPKFKHQWEITSRLNRKFDEICKANNGVPEDLDRICIETTGLSLRNYIAFFTEFILRAHMYKTGALKDPFDFLDTIGFKQGEDEPDFLQISEEEYDHYIRCWKITKKKDLDKCFDFQFWLLDTNEFSGGVNNEN